MYTRERGVFTISIHFGIKIKEYTLRYYKINILQDRTANERWKQKHMSNQMTK